jgi:type VI protein secretion system component VasK
LLTAARSRCSPRRNSPELIVAACIIIPPLLRMADGRSGGSDWPLLIMGTLLLITWLVITSLDRRQRRRELDELRQLNGD